MKPLSDSHCGAVCLFMWVGGGALCVFCSVNCEQMFLHVIYQGCGKIILFLLFIYFIMYVIAFFFISYFYFIFNNICIFNYVFILLWMTSHYILFHVFCF